MLNHYLSPQAQLSLLIYQRRKNQAALTQSIVRPNLNNWLDWLAHYFSSSTQYGFAPHHIEFWDWVWTLKKGIRPQPFVALWSRGGAKSSSAELAAAMCAIQLTRHYIVYVCETQDQADKHVATIATLLESAKVERALNKYGSSKGWRRNRLRTNQGATIDALGLDTAARGIKVDDDRPDMMILDDIDGRHDSLAATQKKIETLTTTILPAGSSDCAVVFIQNLIHTNSIAAQLADGRADFLLDRQVSGPYKAINNLKYEPRDGKYVIVAGTPTWEGQDLATCEGQINSWGLESFLREAQHEVAQTEGSVYGDVWDDSPEGNVTDKAEYEPGNGELLWAIDDGYAGEWIPQTGYYSAESHPRVILLCQLRPNGILCVYNESYAVKVESLQHLNQVLENMMPLNVGSTSDHEHLKPERVGLGREMAELRGSLHKLGIYTLAGPSNVDESTKVLRSWIAPDANRVRKVLVHPRCKILRKEPPLFSHIEGTQWEDRFGHGLAALRYLVWALRHSQ